MPSLAILTAASLFAGWLVLTATTWRRNFTTGKSAGFPTFYSPSHISDIWWLASYKYVVPWLQMLPTKWSQPWSSLNQIWHVWKIGYAPYRAVGADSIMLATPQGNMLWTCDAAVMTQIMERHGETVIPTDKVSIFNIWGPSIVTTEGKEWKKHRRIVTAGFNPTTNSAVWRETLRQSRLMIAQLQKEGSVIRVAKDWTLRFTLNVISGVLFNRQLDFEGQIEVDDHGNKSQQMDFQSALMTVILQLTWIVTLPRAILPFMPSVTLKKAGLAITTLTATLRDLHQSVAKDLDALRSKRYKTVLESIVLAAAPDGAKDGESLLTPEDVFGNLFMMLLAGHETTGNTLAFILLLLAVYPEHQDRIKADIDKQLGDRTQDNWSVEQDFAVLEAGMIGAVQKEVLRLYQVVQFIWRRVTTTITVIDSQGTSHTIPADTLVLNSWGLVTRHPNVWKEKAVPAEKRQKLHESPAMYFDPTRWLRPDAVEQNEVVLGSFFPFGLGARSCPGRLFATVELTAAMAAIFKDYSLELVISDKTLQSCDGDKFRAWEKTRDNAIRTLYDDISSVINIELHTPLPIRLVKRHSR